MPGDDQWRRSLREAMAERAMRHRRPEPDELIDYLEGRLSAAEREEIEEAAAHHPEVARELAELAAFPGTDPDAGVPPLGEDELTASWQRFRPRLASLRPSSPPARRATVRWTLAHAAALFFFLTTLALLVALARDTFAPPAPLPNVAVAELSPVGEEVRRADGEPTVRLATEAQPLLVVLALAEAREFPAYRLTLTTASGESLWRTDELHRFDDGTFRLLLPRQLVAEGRYRLELFGRGDDGDVPLARYELSVETE
jgi:hypothetical protein